MLACETGSHTPALLEVCWSEPLGHCVLHGDHCWHVQIVTGLGPARIVQAARSCCWCGLRQTARSEQACEQHGPLGSAAWSLLDLAIGSGERRVDSLGF